jgi:hypothetical protein
MGRNSKENNLLKNIDIIKELKAQGATDVQIAGHLGICKSTWYKYIKENEELKAALEEGKAELCSELVGKLVTLARGGYSLTTTRTVENDNGIVTETTVKEQAPNLGALMFALKNLDSEHFTSEPRMVKLKEQELELKKTVAENNNWLSFELEEL